MGGYAPSPTGFCGAARFASWETGEPQHTHACDPLLRNLPFLPRTFWYSTSSSALNVHDKPTLSWPSTPYHPISDRIAASEVEIGIS